WPVVGVSRPWLSPHPPRLSHLELDNGRELAPRRVPDHHEHALDYLRRDHVRSLVALAWGGRDDRQAVPRATPSPASAARRWRRTTERRRSSGRGRSLAASRTRVWPLTAGHAP